MTLRFSEGDKFALIAVANVYTEISGAEQLNGGTWVLSEFPIEIESHWKEWVGSVRFERMSESNLVLVQTAQSAQPEILDQEHETLAAVLLPLFHLLQLGGVIEYEAADLIKGSFVRGTSEARQLVELDRFRPTKGNQRTEVTISSLQTAAALGSSWKNIKTSGQFKRFLRGLDILIEGLKQPTGDERLHHFVRSLEALILPDPGATKRQFAHRCQTFAYASPATRTALEESFDLRSDTEHVHEWDRSLTIYPQNDREDVGLLRTRQMERLASDAYGRILQNSCMDKLVVGKNGNHIVQAESGDCGASRAFVIDRMTN